MLKKILLAILLLLPCHGDAFWHGSNLQQGGGPNLLIANVFSPPYGAVQTSRTRLRPASSTTDYYNNGGTQMLRPYDLQNCCGSWGTTIAAANGRYLWLIQPDHPEGTLPDQNAIYAAFSSDPVILPDPSTMVPIIPWDGGGSAASFPMTAMFVYNPDDVGHEAYIFTEGINTNAGGVLQEIMWKRADFSGLFTFVGVSHVATTSKASYQWVYRLGTGSWSSFGLSDDAVDPDAYKKWISSNTTNPVFATTGSVISPRDNSNTTAYTSLNLQGPQIVVGGNTFAAANEDNCSGTFDADLRCTGTRTGQYVSKAQVNASTGQLVTSSGVRISSIYSGVYTGPSYLQAVTTYCEDGVCLWYATHGFFSDVPPGVPPFGIRAEFLDIYATVEDQTAAANAAPMGVSVSVASGTATLSWYDPVGLPTHSYNVYRSTAAGTKGSLVGSTSGTTFSDSPTASSSCTLYFYRVYKVDGSSVEQQFRPVSTFVSSSAALVNAHITRACQSGVDFATIDRTWMNTLDTWLETTCNCLNQLQFFSDPSFGKQWNSGTGVISRVFDLGTTYLPRGGDITFTNVSTHTTGSSTIGSNSVSAWAGADSQAFGYYGNFNRGTGFQGRTESLHGTVGGSVFAVYSNTTGFSMTLLGIANTGGINLKSTATGGSCSNCASFSVGAYFNAWNPTQFYTDNLALSGTTNHIVGGSYDGATVKVFVEGVAGSGAGPTPNTGSPFLGATQSGFLTHGTDDSAYTYASTSIPGTYLFNAGQAQLTVGALAVFQPQLTDAQIASLTALYRTRIGP